jgi:hypothetical protein
MYKLLKWEVKSKYKFILATLGILAVVNLWLLTLVKSGPNNAIPFGFSIMAAMTASFIIAIDGIATFTKSLKRDYKYLLFSVPRNGYERIGSNLIMAAVKLLIVMIFGALFILINGLYTMNVLGNGGYSQLFTVLSKLHFEMFFTVTVILAAYIAFLVTIYFSKIVCKSVLKGIRFSGLITFIFFLATYSVITKMLSFIESVFKYSFDIKLFTNFNESSGTFNSDKIHMTVSNISVNAAGLIFGILVVVLMFLTASYVLDKDVDV